MARRIGKFEEADGGTLLLDEISEMDVRLQAKLLRAIQERTIDRVGGSAHRSRSIFASLPPPTAILAEAVREGIFREDLLYRLNVVNLKIPPLRERPGDILALAELLCQKICRRQRPATNEHYRQQASLRQPDHKSMAWQCARARKHSTPGCPVIFGRLRLRPMPFACLTVRQWSAESIHIESRPHGSAMPQQTAEAITKSLVGTDCRRSRTRSHYRYAASLPWQSHPCRHHIWEFQSAPCATSSINIPATA